LRELGQFWRVQEKKQSQESWIYMRYFAACCMCYKVAVSGECCQKSFQNGAIVTIIKKNGAKSQGKTKKVFWKLS